MCIYINESYNYIDFTVWYCSNPAEVLEFVKSWCTVGNTECNVCISCHVEIVLLYGVVGVKIRGAALA